MRWSGIGTLFFLGVFIVSGACSVAIDRNGGSGTDATRNGAIEFPMGRTVIDNVDFDGLDMTDWKYFSVQTNGLVNIMVSFDNHDAGAIARVRDAKGLIITTLEDHGQQINNMFRGEPGYYYIEIWCERASTDYTIEVHFEAL